MAASTSKRVLIQRFDRESLQGYVNPAAYLAAGGVELLSQTGSVSVVPYADVKAVCFVADFDGGNPLRNKAFTSRPKTAGLWVRLKFRDGETMDGVVPNNLLQIEGQGFTVTPPDLGGGGAQRLFVPREALTSIEVLGVVGSALRPKKKPEPEGQLRMFDKEGHTPGGPCVLKSERRA